MLSSCFSGNQDTVSINNYQALLNHANQLYETNHPDEGFQLLRDAAIILSRVTITQRIGTYQFYYNYYHQVKLDNKKAALYIDSMQAILNTDEKIKAHLAVYGKTYFLRGDILSAENRLTEAYYNYYKGKKIINSLIDDCGKSEYTYRMGMIMYRQQDYKKAATYFKSASREINTCNLTFNSFYRRQELLNNTALAYSKLQLNDSAAFYYKKALIYVQNNRGNFTNVDRQFKLAAAVIKGNLADIYVKQQRYNDAIELYRQSIAVTAQPDYDINDAELSEAKLASLYALLHQPEAMMKIIRSLQLHLEAVPNLNAIASMENLLVAYYTDRGDYKQALLNFRKYRSLKDSLEKNQEYIRKNDVNQQLNRYEKDYELAALRKHSGIQRIYLIAAIVFVIMTLLIFVLIYIYLRKSARSMRALDELNKRINQQNENLESALNELKSSNQEKDRILHTVAHDLRNPVGGIASLSSMLVNETKFDTEQQSLLAAIRDAANDSLILISELLEVAGNQSIELNRQEVEVNQLVVNCVELLNHKAAEKNQTLRVSLLDEPQSLWVSREKIWRVLSNLLSNAIKFSQVNSEIAVNLSIENEYIKFAVHDDGIGIPDQLKPEVFNMFTHAKRQGTLGEKSFGLGLSISKQIIDQHSGELWFESNQSTGTTFYFLLPLKK